MREEIENILKSSIKYTSNDIKTWKVRETYIKFCRKYYPDKYTSEYKLVSIDNLKKSKNWKYFDKCRKLLDELNAPLYGFMEAQFRYAKRPVYPNNLYSEYAKKKFLRYLEEIEGKYIDDGTETQILNGSIGGIEALKDAVYIVSVLSKSQGKSKLEMAKEMEGYVSGDYVKYLQGELNDTEMVKQIRKMENEL